MSPLGNPKRVILFAGWYYVPLTFAPGEAYQFDWSHEIVVLNGATVTVKAAHVRLCYSRMMFVRAYPSETQEMVFRAIDIRSICGDGETVLDLAPESLDQRVYLEELRTALRECHGTAFQPYIEFLQSLGRDEVEAQTRSHIESFVQQMPGTTDGVARGIAANFGLLYAGAALAIRAQVLPWTEDHLNKALSQAFADAIEESKVVDPRDMAKEILVRNLALLHLKRKKVSALGSDAPAGYWTINGGEKEFVVQTRQFRAWFPSAGLRNVALDWLTAEGRLKRAEGPFGNLASSEDRKGMLRRWPGGKLVRSFVFSDPFFTGSNMEWPEVENEGGAGQGSTKSRKLGAMAARQPMTAKPRANRLRIPGSAKPAKLSKSPKRPKP